MTSAATRILLLASLVFGGLSGSAGAGVQLDPADTLSSAVSTAASPTGQASDLTNSASDLTNSVGDAADGVTGSVNDAVEDVAGTVNDATGSVTGGTASGGGGGGGGGGGSGSSPLDSATGAITGVLSGSSDSGQAARLRVEAQDRARPRAGVRHRREMDQPRIGGRTAQGSTDFLANTSGSSSASNPELTSGRVARGCALSSQPLRRGFGRRSRA